MVYSSNVLCGCVVGQCYAYARKGKSCGILKGEGGRDLGYPCGTAGTQACMHMQYTRHGPYKVSLPFIRLTFHGREYLSVQTCTLLMLLCEQLDLVHAAHTLESIGLADF